MISVIHHSASRKAKSRFFVQVAWDVATRAARKTGVFAPNFVFLKRPMRSDPNHRYNNSFGLSWPAAEAKPKFVLERRLGPSTVACFTIQGRAPDSGA